MGDEIPMKTMKAEDHHNSLLDAMKAVLQDHSDMDAEEMLAVLSQLLGQLVAMQDQEKMTVERAQRIIEHNLVQGNQAAIEYLMQSEGQA